MAGITKYIRNNFGKGLKKILKWSNKSCNRDDLHKSAVRYIKFGESNVYSTPHPVGPSPTPKKIVQKHRYLSDPKPFVCELKSVELVGPLALPIDTQNRYIIEDTGGGYNILSITILNTVVNGQLPLRRGGGMRCNRPITSLVGAWSQGYFHWFAEYLPQVRGLEIYAGKTGTYPDVLVAEDSPAWLSDSLRFIGVPDERIIEWTGKRVLAEQYVVPSLPRYTDSSSPPWGYTPSPQALKWTRNRILKKLDINQRSINRIIVTRRDAHSRQIHNEKKVIEALSPYGFKPVVLTDLQFSKQVRMFAHAEIVVAPHGAGLVNIIYSDNIKVVELFGKRVNACYYCISGGFGFEYRYEIGENHNGDIIVDYKSLKNTIKKLVV
ncbi:glycosyltransferase family 61 protein [Salinibacter ruber]|uniref:Glycosyltransferase 61 catalytic domain-containing protein n=1 Tax=Salinibacter ruber TaxID=146919 RepID=A0AAW5P9F8_9BACT|nr:glycosyltransferase family 61 protein [Salinibacter ruber]MCS4157962.1 hypothetical protein [Salinibacter ruber]